MSLVALVPAYNEEPTVARVVLALRRADVFDEVYVVDDGSDDDTSGRARIAGARVIRPAKNLGKGGAMLYGLRKVDPRADVGFFDADLLGFEPEHAQQLAARYADGYDMVCGLCDYGVVQNLVQLCFPLITGQRIIRRWVLDAVPVSCWSGFGIETAMNEVVTRRRGKTALVRLRGVDVRSKGQKGGLLHGWDGHMKMFRQMGRTKRSLRRSDGASCEDEDE